MIDKIKNILKENGYYVTDIKDNSAHHAHHITNDSKNKMSHLKITISLKGKEGQNQALLHKHVNKILKNFFLEIHSISIDFV